MGKKGRTKFPNFLNERNGGRQGTGFARRGKEEEGRGFLASKEALLQNSVILSEAREALLIRNRFDRDESKDLGGMKEECWC